MVEIERRGEERRGEERRGEETVRMLHFKSCVKMSMCNLTVYRQDY